MIACIFTLDEPLVAFANSIELGFGNDLILAPTFQVAEVLPYLPGDQAGIGGGLGQHGFASEETMKIVGHFARGSVAGGGVLFQGFEADVLQIAGNAGGAAAR